MNDKIKILEFTNRSVYAIQRKDILMHRQLKTIYCGEVDNMPEEYKDRIDNKTMYVIIY